MDKNAPQSLPFHFAGDVSLASGGIIHFSNGCSGNDPTGSAMYVSATSLAVSYAAQKNGGDNAQPICRAEGTTISIGSPGRLGKT